MAGWHCNKPGTVRDGARFGSFDHAFHVFYFLLTRCQISVCYERKNNSRSWCSIQLQFSAENANEFSFSTLKGWNVSTLAEKVMLLSYTSQNIIFVFSRILFVTIKLHYSLTWKLWIYDLKRKRKKKKEGKGKKKKDRKKFPLNRL